MQFSAKFPHFLALFLESAENPLFVQINALLAVWALMKVDRKYTTLDVSGQHPEIMRSAKRSDPFQDYPKAL